MIWRAAVDLLVLATAIYLVLLWGREARALRAFVAILGMRAGALVARRLDLAITEWVFETASLVALDVAVDSRSLSLPSGLTLEGLSPARVRVDLTASSTISRQGKERQSPAP